MLIDPDFWRGKSVFITGHTGFKGGWLATWLHRLGANVHGYALTPDTVPSYFVLCALDRVVHSTIGDIRDTVALQSALRTAAPDVVFHLAAQPLVRRSYAEPAATFATNVMGTVNLLEAVRATPSVRAIVIVTSDKCYRNREWDWGYRESDPLGGRDPYSASKACAELVSASYRESIFASGQTPVAIATARAGNVIGGGDWAPDRIVPDAVRAFVRGETLIVRNPDAVRPWQHVLEPLGGYLTLAARLYCEGGAYADAWNFGPDDGNEISVARLVEALSARWSTGARWRAERASSAPYEHRFLMLDSSRARKHLGWRPRLPLEERLEMTVEWYQQALMEYSNGKMNRISSEQIARYQTHIVGAPNEIH